MLKTTIEIPEMNSLYWYSSEKKEAVIDHEKHEITTTIDDKSYTQKFYLVEKYELFTMLKFIVSAFVLFLLMHFDISIRNEIGLLVATIATIAWHQWGKNQKSIFNINQVEINARIVLLFSIAALIIIFTIVGLFTSTLSYVSRSVLWVLISILLYEIIFEFISQSWQQHRKVYVEGLPHFIPRYFKLPEDERSIKNRRIAKQKINDKIYIALMIIAAIAIIGLVYDGATAYKTYKSQQITIAKYNKVQQLKQLKFQAEQNGSVQILITYEKVKLAPNIEELHRELNIPVSYKEIKKITYPWEPGYRGPVTMIENPVERNKQ